MMDGPRAQLLMLGRNGQPFDHQNESVACPLPVVPFNNINDSINKDFPQGFDYVNNTLVDDSLFFFPSSNLLLLFPARKQHYIT